MTIIDILEKVKSGEIVRHTKIKEIINEEEFLYEYNGRYFEDVITHEDLFREERIREILTYEYILLNNR